MPRNPLINAGALVVTDTLLDGGDAEADHRRDHWASCASWRTTLPS